MANVDGAISFFEGESFEVFDLQSININEIYAITQICLT